MTGAGNRISRSHTIGDRVVLVIEAKVKRAGHEDTDDGLVYSEQLKVVDMFEVDDPAAGRLLSTVRQSYREADDQRHGRRPLLEVPERLGVDGWTDGSGVVATDGDLADVDLADPAGALGDELALPDPARALVDESLAAAVVVFSDRARTLWPDEFEAGEVCPKAGDRYEDGPGPADYVFVAKVLDAESGEVLDEWSDEQESGRLQRLEEELAAGEGLSTSGEGSGPVTAPVDSQGENPDPSPPDHVVLEAPGPSDFGFVDREAAEIKAVLSGVTDAGQARRLLMAEQAGRGRGLKPRKGVLEMLERHLAKVGGPHPAVSAYGDAVRAAATAVPALPGEEDEAF